MVNQYQVRGGTNIFKGLITEVCRLPVSHESRLRFEIKYLLRNDMLTEPSIHTKRFRIVKDAGALPDDLCLNYVRLDFGNSSTFLSVEEHDWHGENERALIANRDQTLSKIEHDLQMGGVTCQQVVHITFDFWLPIYSVSQGVFTLS